jgi:hypothetical protein
MQEKEETTDILENLERKKRIRRTASILIVLILLVIVGVFIVLLLTYFKTPEKTLGLGANIESSLLSADGKIAYIKLAGGSLDKNITKIKFIFTDENKAEHYYETSEGIKEIEIPYTKTFWDIILGIFGKKPNYSGVYDYEINSDEIGIDDFNSINEVSVLFEYETETGVTIETPVLDTTKPKPITTSQGGGGGSPSGDGGTTTCTPESKETTCGSWVCGIKKNNCNEDVNCGSCEEGYKCENGKCILQTIGLYERLVGYWKFESSSGGITPDETRVNNGNLINNAIIANDAERGKVLSLDGDIDYVDCGNDSSLNLQGALTLMAWINPKSFGGKITDKGWHNATGSDWEYPNRNEQYIGGFSFDIKSSWLGRPNISSYVVYGGWVDTSEENVIGLNKWQHIALVWNQSGDGNISFYVNGVKKGSRLYTGAHSGDGNPRDSVKYNLTIGIRKQNLYWYNVSNLSQHPNPNGFNGSIDEVMIYNRALNESEIWEIYNSQKPAISCTNDSGCSSIGSFCQEEIPFNCSLNISDGCLDRVNKEECILPEQCVGGSCQLISENTFFVSVSGAESHNGSLENEFNLSEAQAYANTNPDTELTFLLQSGSYGGFVDTTNNRTAWATWKGNGNVSFRKIHVGDGSGKNLYLRFDGIDINSEQGSGRIAYVQNANYVEFLNCKMVYYDRYPNGDIIPEFAGNYLKIDNCEIYAPDPIGDYALPPTSKARGMNIHGYNIEVTNNKIHDISSTGILVEGPSSMLIENNEIYNHYFHWPGFRYSVNTTAASGNGSNTTTFVVTDRYYDSYYAKMYCSINSQSESYVTSYDYPTGTITLSIAKLVSIGDAVKCRDEYIHGNSITIEGAIGNIIIRNNTMHSSRDGIAVYTVLATNLTIENNVMYDTTGIDLAGNTPALGVGPNVRINNNTIVMQYDKNPWEGAGGEWSGSRYGEAIQAPFDSSYDGSLELKNNVIVGRFGFSNNNFISENNIVFCTGNILNNSTVFTPDCSQGNIKSYKQLEDGWDPEEDFFVEENFNFSSNHYQERDLRPKASGALCNPTINSYVAQYGKVGALPCVLDCVNGNTRVCGTDVGICVPGVETCVSDVWSGVCEGAVLPQEEVCGNLIDEDCDGEAPGCMEFKRISYWKFEDDLSDNMTIDENGNHNGTCSGARCPLYKPAGGIDGEGVYEFDGIDDYIYVGVTDVMNSNYTVSAWINLAREGGISDYILGARQRRFMFRVDNNNIILYHKDPATQISSGYTFNKSTWYHVAGTFNNKTGMELFVNGIYIASALSQTNYNKYDGVRWIGAGALSADTPEYFFNGSLDEVMIYNRALNETEIIGIYCNQGGKTLNPDFCADYGFTSLSPFTRLWNFLKSILTGKTGQAILTGKITGNAAGDGNVNYKKPSVILAFLAVIILIIVIMIVKIKKKKFRKKSGKKFGKR